MTHLKKLKYTMIAVIPLCLLLLFLETITRLGVWINTGNDIYLTWGFHNPDLQEKAKEQIDLYDGYFKLKKNKIYNFLNWASEPVRVNSFGFRGDDFDIEPGPNVHRIITLGASSTFCFLVNDNQTWPYFLESKLNHRISGGGMKLSMRAFLI